MINIVTRTYPYRLDIKSKEPIELLVEITNVSSTSKLLSCDVVLDKELCLEKNSLKKSEHKRLGEIGANQKIQLRYEIHPFQGVKAGNHKIKIKINEHFNDYSYIENVTEKFIMISVM